MEIPGVRPGELVVVLLKDREPHLFQATGKIARLDYNPYKGENKVYGYGNEDMVQRSVSRRINAAVGEGAYKEYARVFGQIGPSDITLHEMLFYSSPGVAIGVNIAAGFLEFQYGEEGARYDFRFRGRSFRESRIPAENTVGNDSSLLNRGSEGIYHCSADNLQSLIVGTKDITAFLEGTPYKIFIDEGIIPQLEK